MKKLIILVLALASVFLYLNLKKQRLIQVGDAKVRVEIMEAEAQREKGLSDRKSLCSGCGMLFVFDQPAVYPFWMRRMNFDIDILWIAGERIVDITYDAKKPSKEEFETPKTIYQSKFPVDKVLEVNAGWVEKNRVKIGDVVK